MTCSWRLFLRRAEGYPGSSSASWPMGTMSTRKTLSDSFFSLDSVSRISDST